MHSHFLPFSLSIQVEHLRNLPLCSIQSILNIIQNYRIVCTRSLSSKINHQLNCVVNCAHLGLLLHVCSSPWLFNVFSTFLKSYGLCYITCSAWSHSKLVSSRHHLLPVVRNFRARHFIRRIHIHIVKKLVYILLQLSKTTVSSVQSSTLMTCPPKAPPSSLIVKPPPSFVTTMQMFMSVIVQICSWVIFYLCRVMQLLPLVVMSIKHQALVP